MTNYPQYPTDPAAQGGGAPVVAQGPPPATVEMAVKLIWAAVALSVVSAIIGFLQLDAAVDAALEGDTTGSLTEASARAGVIVFIVIVMAVGVGIYALLAVFIKRGKNWARIVFTVLAALFLILGVLGLGADQTALSLVVAIVQIALTAATLFFLWKPESNAYFSAR